MTDQEKPKGAANDSGATWTCPGCGTECDSVKKTSRWHPETHKEECELLDTYYKGRASVVDELKEAVVVGALEFNAYQDDYFYSEQAKNLLSKIKKIIGEG